MYVGDRARFLVSRGIDPLAEADLSVSAQFHNKTLARRLRLARASFFALGCCATALLGTTLHFQPVTPHETVELAALSRAGVDAEHPLPDDLSIRLSVPRADITAVAAILSSGASVEPDMSWAAALDGHPGLPMIAPSRLAALHGVVAYLAQLAPDTWPAILNDFRVATGLSDAARDLLGALRPLPASDLHQLPSLLRTYMALSPDRRQALEQAGFPPVPADPAQQQLYVLLGRVGADQNNLVYRLLRDRDLQRTLPRIASLLPSRDVRRLLGVIADGIYGVPDLSEVPSTCDVARPGSCKRAQ